MDNHPEFTSVVIQTFLGGHEVVVVPTIAAACAEAETTQFDVALVDYDLDDGKGVEFVRWVRAARPSMPLIAVSARAEGNDALVAAGADRVCAKTSFSRIRNLLDELSRS